MAIIIILTANELPTNYLVCTSVLKTVEKLLMKGLRPLRGKFPTKVKQNLLSTIVQNILFHQDKSLQTAQLYVST
jgi:hypothetical protein